MEALLAEHPKLDDCSVEVFLTGGDRLREVSALPSHGKLYNCYGPTESTVVATSTPVDSISGLPPIGRPITNTEAFILDEFMEPVPVGVTGELYLGGASLARGYLNRPELTAERFVPHPHSRTPGQRLYRTGDLSRYRQDRQLEFVGRLDQQVMLRAHRIELGEIEKALQEHPDVKACVVVLRNDLKQESYLAAYVVKKAGTTTDLQSLRAHLKRLLPSYMVPSRFLALDDLPLTTTGKIDRLGLPEIAFDSEALPTHVMARTALEETLSGVWTEMLKCGPVGIEDNFFEIGGHSLLATRMLGRVENLLGLSVALRSFFETPTIKGLAESLVKNANDAEELERTAQVILDVAAISDSQALSMLGEITAQSGPQKSCAKA
jgi:hypothetical protein